MESCNGRSGRTAIRHVHESKAARVACLGVGHHSNRVHSAIQLEELSEVLISRGTRKVANKNVHTKVLLGSVLSRSPEYASSIQKPYRGEMAKGHLGDITAGQGGPGWHSPARHEDKSPLHHTRTEELRP